MYSSLIPALHSTNPLCFPFATYRAVFVHDLWANMLRIMMYLQIFQPVASMKDFLSKIHDIFGIYTSFNFLHPKRPSWSNFLISFLVRLWFQSHRSKRLPYQFLPVYPAAWSPLIPYSGKSSSSYTLLNAPGIPLYLNCVQEWKQHSESCGILNWFSNATF